MSTTLSLAQLRDDLRWSVASPPLLHGDHDLVADWPSADFFTDLWQTHQQPSISRHDLDQLPAMRLGHYFEHLWHLWLRNHPRYSVVLANEAWRENGITLGETDLIVRDQQTEQIEHWELAVKFYLGFGDLQSRAHWHGPQFRDRLDHKFDHLKTMQTRLTQTQPVKNQLHERGIHISRIRCLVKGRLFLPWEDYWAHTAIHFAAPMALRGFWLTRLQWEKQREQYPYCRRLSREQFLSVLQERSDPIDFIQTLEGELERPIALAICDASGTELCRGFVVPDSWPQQAMVMQSK